MFDNMMGDELLGKFRKILTEYSPLKFLAVIPC